MELRSCPNCGHNMERGALIGKVVCPKKTSKWHVECPSCRWRGKSMPFLLLAEIAWNVGTKLNRRYRK